MAINIDSTETNTYNNQYVDDGEDIHRILELEEYQGTKASDSLDSAIEPLVNTVSNLGVQTFVAKYNCQNMKNTLTTDQSAAIMLYTMGSSYDDKSFYRRLNSALCSFKRSRDDNLKPWFSYLKIFMSALSCLPKHRGIVYRAVKLDLSRSYPIGKKFIWWSFSTCIKSLDTLLAELSGEETEVGTIFVIDCYSGRDIQAYAYFSQHEVLLQPGCQFIVESRMNPKPNLWIINIKEIATAHYSKIKYSPSRSTFEVSSPTKHFTMEIPASMVFANIKVPFPMPPAGAPMAPPMTLSTVDMPAPMTLSTVDMHSPMTLSTEELSCSMTLSTAESLGPVDTPSKTEKNSFTDLGYNSSDSMSTSSCSSINNLSTYVKLEKEFMKYEIPRETAPVKEHSVPDINNDLRAFAWTMSQFRKHRQILMNIDYFTKHVDQVQFVGLPDSNLYYSELSPDLLKSSVSEKPTKVEKVETNSSNATVTSYPRISAFKPVIRYCSPKPLPLLTSAKCGPPDTPVTNNSDAVGPCKLSKETLEKKVMRFQNIKISSEYAQDIAKEISDNPLVQILYFVNNGLKDEAFTFIINALADRSQLRLFVMENELTDISVSCIAKLISSNAEMFSIIYLDKNLISSSGVKTIARAVARDSKVGVRTISFSGNSLVNDDCVCAIAIAIEENRVLTSLYLENCSFSDYGKQRLQQIVHEKKGFCLQL